MEERSFRRAALFGILGALIFLVVGVLLCEVFKDLKGSPVFRTHALNLDLLAVAVQIRINLFVVIGFIVGWGYCLCRGRRRGV